jgi:hypothetical protein
LHKTKTQQIIFATIHTSSLDDFFLALRRSNQTIQPYTSAIGTRGAEQRHGGCNNASTGIAGLYFLLILFPTYHAAEYTI